MVLDPDEIQQICSQVKDDLDRLFARFTSFPTNVDVTVIDRIDVDSMFNTKAIVLKAPTCWVASAPRRSTTRPDTK